MMIRVVLLAGLVALAAGKCPNGCNGHGSCNEFDECTCYNEGKSTYFGYLYDTAKGYERIKEDAIRTAQASGSTFGYTATLTQRQNNKYLSKTAYIQKQFTGPDCSMMTCPRGVSWTKNFMQNYDAGTVSNLQVSDGHSACRHADFAECSDAGVCDRGSGECQCFDGYEGAACQRTSCPDDCSGHGQCQSNIEFSKDGSAKRALTGGLASEGYFESAPDANQVNPEKFYLKAWDSGIHFGCKCDVGFRGVKCDQIECPSTTDPLGWYGNDDGEDCSGRGLCDYSTGECQCFEGFTGVDCGTVEALA